MVTQIEQNAFNVINSKNYITMNNEQKSPWPGPEGMIPVTSGRADDANVHTRNYLDQILVEMRAIDAVMPELKTRIFGREYSSPIMMPAFSHLNKVVKDERKPMNDYAQAAQELNLLNFVGMEPDEEYADIVSCGADTVRIIKPFADHDVILEQIAYAREHGAVAVGVDIDHVPGKDGQYDKPDGIALGPVMLEDLKKYVEAAQLPFVAKGVLSVQEALKCREAGVSAVLVSHHHGRIPFGVPPAFMLPKIKEALKDSSISIFCDCHVDTGYDAYKLLALGADAVAPGRSILAPLLKEGKEGVIKKIEQMNHQLTELMLYTGIRDTKSFDPSVLHINSLLK